MGLSIQPQTKMSQKPAMSLEMQRSLKLLELSKPELIQQILQELEGNPALEIVEESTPEDSMAAITDLKNDSDSSESSWESGSERDDEETSESDEPVQPKKPSAGLLQPPQESLTDFLLKQLRLTRLTPDEMRIGSVIADSLDEDGS